MKITRAETDSVSVIDKISVSLSVIIFISRLVPVSALH